MPASDLHVVFGAAGGAGNAVVRVLAAGNRRVRAVTRGAAPHLSAGVEHVAADALDGEAVRRACTGAGVVFHCINTPYETWAATLPPILEHLISGAAEEDATLVYCDNLYMYGVPDGPLREDSPMRPTGAKGALRARLAERLFDAHERGTVRATSGRASDFYGPGAGNTIAGQLVFPAVLAGRRARWLGSLDQPHSIHYIDDVARALVRLGAEPGAAGSAWHIPAGPAVTGRTFIGTACEVVGGEPRMGAYPQWLMQGIGLFSRRMREIAGIVYQFDRPFTIDATRFTQAFGEPDLVPLRDGVTRSLDWHRANAAG